MLEDDRALRESLAFRFELEGCQIATFATAEDLLAADLPASNACLVLDEILPGKSGSEALIDLRARGVTLPAIIITSHARPALHIQALLASAHIIEKPLLGDALFTLAGNLLSLA